MKRWVAIVAMAIGAVLLGGVVAAVATANGGTNPNAYPCTQTQNGNGAHGMGGSTATCSTNNGDLQGSGANGTPQPSGGNPNQVCNGDPSGHSDSGHGANYDGPYESVCPSGPSLNGNGKGNAVGKPCAGCVGNADDKQPKGQLPGGNDPNAGYECDRNHGVGRSNPAHTRPCGANASTPPPTTTTVTTSTTTTRSTTVTTTTAATTTVTRTTPPSTTGAVAPTTGATTTVTRTTPPSTTVALTPAAPAAPPSGGAGTTTTQVTTQSTPSTPAPTPSTPVTTTSSVAGSTKTTGTFAPPAQAPKTKGTFAPPAQTPKTALPFTGLPVWLVALIGGAAILLGALTLRLAGGPR
jgi:hypothetical protein